MTTQETPRDQRKSERHRCRIQVDLTILGKRLRVYTQDVSRHGLFVETREAVRERFLVQTAIYLPDGPLNATAFVSRRVGPEGAVEGLGLQIFAISVSAKERWDRFIRSLGGGEPHGARGEPGNAEIASFLVKLPSVARLREFQLKTLPTGSLYLATPVLRAIGTSVAVVFIHPTTEAEFSMGGTVLRVHTKTRRGMEIKLDPMTDASWKAFYRFVETGVGLEARSATPASAPPALAPPLGLPGPPATTPRPSGVWSVRSSSTPAPAITPPSTPPPIVSTPPPAPARASEAPRPSASSPDVPRLRKVRAESGFYSPSEAERGTKSDTAVSAVAPSAVAPGASAKSRATPVETTDDLSVDVDLSELTADQQFDWNKVEDELVIDLDLSQVADPSPEPSYATLVARLGDRLPRPGGRSFSVACSGCELSATIAGDAPPGWLGLFARLRPYWSSRRNAILAIPRARASAERAAAAEVLAEIADLEVPVATLRALDRTFDRPRCPETGELLTTPRAIRELWRLSEALGDEPQILEEPCPRCQSGRWTLRPDGGAR